jgi:hypothetical protein
VRPGITRSACASRSERLIGIDEAPRRLYTLAEANAALPEVSSRVERLRSLRDEIRRARELLDILWQRLDAGDPVLATIGERQEILDALAQEFGTHVEAVDAMGVVLRDLDPGLVDFPAEVKGIPIFLCWRAGEAQVTFWHGQSEGFAGRKPISALRGLPGPRAN